MSSVQLQWHMCGRAIHITRWVARNRFPRLTAACPNSRRHVHAVLGRVIPKTLFANGSPYGCRAYRRLSWRLSTRWCHTCKAIRVPSTKRINCHRGAALTLSFMKKSSNTSTGAATRNQGTAFNNLSRSTRDIGLCQASCFVCASEEPTHNYDLRKKSINIQNGLNTIQVSMKKTFRKESPQWQRTQWQRQGAYTNDRNSVRQTYIPAHAYLIWSIHYMGIMRKPLFE